MPPSHVALLRGINVGGKNILKMKDLVASFERLGLEDVSTYIASGNVFFRTSERSARSLEQRIERALQKEHGYTGKVVVRTKKEMEKLVREMPASWKRIDPKRRYNVAFVRHEANPQKILEAIAPRTDIEEAIAKRGVIYWSVRFADAARSRFARIVSSPLYRQITIRNLNTTKKIHELMTKAS